MLDLLPPGTEITADAQTADGTWLRLASCYKDGNSGWLLIDATSLGYGVLLEPVIMVGDAGSTQKLAQPQSMSTDATRPDPTGGVPPSLATHRTLDELLERAALPASYAARLTAVGLPATSSSRYAADEVTEAARQAKLPVGHRMRLALSCNRA